MQVETIDGRTYVNGVEIRTNPEGKVSWASDWIALFAMARKQLYGLRVVHYGPEAFGHSDVVLVRQ